MDARHGEDQGCRCELLRDLLEGNGRANRPRKDCCHGAKFVTPMASAVALSHPDYGSLLMGPAEAAWVCSAVCAALLVVFVFAILLHLSLLAGMKQDVGSCLSGRLRSRPCSRFCRWCCCGFSTGRARYPLAVRRGISLGGCIAAALALPVNIAFLKSRSTSGSRRTRIPFGSWYRMRRCCLLADFRAASPRRSRRRSARLRSSGCYAPSIMT